MLTLRWSPIFFVSTLAAAHDKFAFKLSSRLCKRQTLSTSFGESPRDGESLGHKAAKPVFLPFKFSKDSATATSNSCDNIQICDQSSPFTEDFTQDLYLFEELNIVPCAQVLAEPKALQK